MAAPRPVHASDDDTVPMVQRSLLLKTFPGFAHLSASDLGLLASVTKECFFERGTVILTPGVPVTRFYLLVEGAVQMYDNGEPTQLLGGRSAVGGLASLTQDPKGAHAVVTEDCLALEVDREDMADVFEDSFQILLGVLKALARTLRDLQIGLGGGAVIENASSFSPVDPKRCLGLVERMFLLRQTVSFGNMDIEALAEVAADANEVRPNPGDKLWSVGETADYSLMVLAGELRAETEDGKSWKMGPGYVVGGVDTLADAPRLYDAYAVGEVVALRLDGSSMVDMLEDHTETAMDMVRNLAAGVTNMVARLAAAQATKAA